MSKNRAKGSVRGAARDSTPAQLLAAFRRAWREEDWEAARMAYNTWTNRTGRKRNGTLEGEMLFRAASAAFRGGNLDRTQACLDEALARAPTGGKRHVVGKALCLVRKGRLREGAEVLAVSGDRFHAGLLGHLVSQGRRLPPRREPADPAFEQSSLYSFWRDLGDPQAPDPSSSALGCIRRAYHALLRGEEPDAVLESLRSKPGFEPLAVGLMLVAAVALRRNIRVRNLLSKHSYRYGDDWSLSVLDAHLLLLLREGEHREIEAMEGILAANGLEPPSLGRVRDERLFADGLGEAEAQRWEKAYACFGAIRTRTPAVLHNLALACQRMERRAEANEHWIALLRMERRPKRSDPEPTRLQYAAAARAIAANYLAEDKPEDAIPFLKDAHSLCEDDPQVLEDLAEACLDAESDADALVYARKLFAIDPDSADALIAYVVAVLRSRRPTLIVSVLDEHWERVRNIKPLALLFAEVCAELAWNARKKDPAQSRAIADKVRTLVPDNPFLLYLEGTILAARGEIPEATRRYERVVEVAEGHTTQLILGRALYDEGFPKLSFRLFQRIVECGCEESVDTLYEIASFLAREGAAADAERLCTYGVEVCNLHPGDAADILLEAGEPHRAKGFSLRLVLGSAAEEEEYFLHLLILNTCGESGETLAFAERSLARFRTPRSDAEEGFVELLKDVVRQIKSKGRARIRYAEN